MKYLMIFLLLLTGCSRLKIAKNNFFPASFKAGSCLVKWRDQETHEKFLKGLGKDFTQRLNEKILVHRLENQIIVVHKKINGQYAVSLWNTEYVEEFVEKTIANIYDPSDDLKQKLAFQIWMVYPGELTTMAEDYENMDCEKYEKGTIQ